MIVRILSEGQYDVPDEHEAHLSALDDTVVDAVAAGDDEGFASALQSLTAEVRRLGEPLPDDRFAPSDLVVPFADATLEETKALLASDAGGDANP